MHLEPTGELNWKISLFLHLVYRSRKRIFRVCLFVRVLLIQYTTIVIVSRDLIMTSLFAAFKEKIVFCTSLHMFLSYLLFFCLISIVEQVIEKAKHHFIPATFNLNTIDLACLAAMKLFFSFFLNVRREYFSLVFTSFWKIFPSFTFTRFLLVRFIFRLWYFLGFDFIAIISVEVCG